GAAVKIPVGHDDLGAVAGNALDAIAPATRGLDRGLVRLRPGVHGQRGIQPSQLADLRQEGAETVIEIGAGRHREAMRLRIERRKNAWMRVPVACRRVRAHYVDVAPAGSIPDMRAFSARPDDRKRLVIASAVSALEFDRVHGTPPGKSH